MDLMAGYAEVFLEPFEIVRVDCRRFSLLFHGDLIAILMRYEQSACDFNIKSVLGDPSRELRLVLCST